MKKNNSKPSREQWKELYDAAINIRKIAPWEHLWDTDLIVLKLPDYDEPVYCSVMGRNKECYAIGVYPGFEAVDSFYRLLESQSGDMAEYVAGFEQSCLICHFGDREEVRPEDREVYNELGLRFRGRNEWIYFRTMDPGYFPWFIRAWEADLLIQVLQNLAAAVTPLIRGEIKVDFDSGETIVRSCSKNDGAWSNDVVKQQPRMLVVPQLIVENEVLMAKLRKCKRTAARLEFDVSYLPAIIQANKGVRPYYPQIILLADRKSGLVIDQSLSGKDDPLEENILNMLTDYVFEYGRPASISIRDRHTAAYIGDYCKKANIELIEGKGVPVIDDVIGEFIRSFL